MALRTRESRADRDTEAGRDRVARLVAAARRIADPADVLGVEARALLPLQTGLSPEGVELALTRCLETRPTETEIARLVLSVEPAPRAHVILSANVFVAAHRAIALALAASERVIVRPSRRDPLMTTLLHRAAPELFTIAPPEPYVLASPGDHVFAYGEDATLRNIAAALPPGVTLHAHGSGMGIAVVEPELGRASGVGDLAARLADDVVAFDQRGCLSPRIACVAGTADDARAFAEALAAALTGAEGAVPMGTLTDAEAAAVTRYRDAARYAADVIPAGKGWVGVDTSGSRAGAMVVPPPGRNVHIFRAGPAELALRPLRGKVAAFGIEAGSSLGPFLAEMFPGARASVIGAMQVPAFDGPVETRELA